MSRVKLAKNAGFCMGVRRAMDIALEASLRKDGAIYTYGPLIHNPQILEFLAEKGLTILSPEKDIPGCPASGEDIGPTVIIRAHGVSPRERQKIKDAGMRILDATCPHVGKVQGIIKRYAQEGYAAVIVGERDHAEVQGLLGYADGRGYVVNTLEEVGALPALPKVCFVAQTTQDRNHFQTIVEALQKKFPEAKGFNTICTSTHQRQEEVLALAHRVEAMVVVGGKESGNTRRLVKISEETGIPTFHVETEKELDLIKLSRYAVIGVTAGASTPNWLILKVVERLRSALGSKGFLRYGEKIFRFLVTTYAFLALGAGCLAYASFLIQGLVPDFSSAFIASLYVFSMHVLNRFMDREGEKYKQPWRSLFYERHGRGMIIAGICSATLALTLGWFQGPLNFFLLLSISALGMIYNLPIFPRGFLRYRKLKGIPGSKTLFVALAWGVVTSILPALAQGGDVARGTAVAFLFSTTLVFARSTLYDFQDIQGDLMVGQETIPIVLGRRRTEILIVALLILSGAVLIVAGPWRWASPRSPFFLSTLAYVGFYYWLYRAKLVKGGILFEGVVDGGFIFPILGVLGFPALAS